MSALGALDLKKEADLEKALLIAPFHRWLGLKVRSIQENGIELELPWREEIVSNPGIQSTHGGILAALIDLSGLYAVLSVGGAVSATADLRVDYHKTAKPGRLIVRSRVVKVGRQLSVADTEILDEKAVLVASGRGAYLNGRANVTPALSETKASLV